MEENKVAQITKHTDSSRIIDSGVSGNAPFSSAPTSPEVTRLSGEQAEDQTATESRKAAKWLEERVERLEWILSRQGICAECGAHFIVHKFKDGTMVKCEKGETK